MIPAKLLIGLLAACTLWATGPAQAAPRLDYRLAWRPHEQPAALQAELHFRGEASGRTVLLLPDEWAAASGYADDLHDLRLDGAGARLEAGARPQERVAVHAPGAALRLRWRVLPRVPEPEGPEGLYRNQVGPRYFHVFGHGVWIVPKSLAGDAARVDWRVRLDGLPGRPLLSSYGATTGGRLVVARRGVPFETLRHALFAGGDFRLVNGRAAGRALAVAVRGDWRFNDAAFVQRVFAIVQAQHRFWPVAPAGERFTVTLMPNRLPAGSVGGTLVEGAFALAASADFDPSSRSFTHLVAHEHMHRWMPGAFGPMGDDEARRYWFSEGFDDYLTHRSLVAAGLWSLQDHADAQNAKIFEWVQSPAREADDERVAAQFFSDETVQRLPYLRGEWLALRWHAALGGGAGGLDTLLRRLARPNGAAGEKQLASERLLAALQAPLHGRARADVAHHVERGAMVAFAPGLLGPCFVQAQEPLRVYELGADRQALRERSRIEQLVPDSALARAGAREGDRMIDIDLLRDPRRPATMTVERDGGERVVLRWLPARERPGELLPVYAVRPGAARDAACRAWFGSGTLRER